MNTAWSEIIGELRRLYLEEDRRRSLKVFRTRDHNVPVHEVPVENLAKEIRMVSAEYDAEVQESITQWCYRESFSEISDHAQIWRYIRVHTVFSYISMVEVPTSQVEVFSKPTVSNENVIKWFLSDWWYIRGPIFRGMLERTI